MAKVKIFINGQKIVADSNQTIIEIVHQEKLDHIPNLCLEKQLEPFNSCYLCLVEVKGRPKLVPACSTKVQDQMEIFTRTQKVLEGRKTSLELMLSSHFADCLPPCSLKCPAGVDIQGYLALIEMGEYQEAVKVIKRTNPFPAVCGRVCTRPCELACRRNMLDKNVGIDFLKRFAADYDLDVALEHIKPECAPLQKEKIAIIGGGPSGLSAAYYLRIAGYASTVFEAMPDAGGMLRYGIPPYRLPFDLLDREISTILELGVDLRTNMALGDEITISSLLNDGYKAVYLALGAWGSRKLGCAGQDAEGVLSGIKFLEEVNSGRNPQIYGRVVVVGGGNTAIDCARTSIRLGAKEVVLLYRRTRAEMPANVMEIDAAEHEGVKMIFLSAPVEVITENNRIKSLKCIRMELGEPDDSGRRRPVEIPNSDYLMECDFAFAAIGQMPKIELFSDKNSNLLPAPLKINVTRWGSVTVNPDTFETNIEAVFAGGDLVSGAATAIEAIASGRKAAYAIGSFIHEGIPDFEPRFFNSKKDDFREVKIQDLRYSDKKDFHPMPELSAKERILSFVEVEEGYSEADARAESDRCLECGCEALFECKLREYATEYGIKVEKYAGSVNEYSLDRSHPLLELDPNKCILCARCIRVCTDIVGTSVYGFYARGFSTIVKPEMGRPLIESQCISCGNCEASCPTGAISIRYANHKPGPWKLSKTSTTCNYCGVGCNIFLGHTHERVLRTFAGEADSFSRGNLCALGRFGFEFIHSSDRIKEPIIKEDGKRQKADWTDVFKRIVNQIKSVQSDGSKTAVFVSPRLSNEEIYLIQKFARTILKTQNIGSMITCNDVIRSSLHLQSTATREQIENADVVFSAMNDFRQDNTVADFMIRRAKRAGAIIIHMSSEDDALSKIANIHLRIKPGADIVALQGLLRLILDSTETQGKIQADRLLVSKVKELCLDRIHEETGIDLGKLEKAAARILSAAKPVVVCQRDHAGFRDIRDLPMLNEIARVSNASIAIFSTHNNLQGLLDMGVHSHLPGLVSIGDTIAQDRFEKGWRVSMLDLKNPQPDIFQALVDKKFETVFIFGEDIVGSALDSKKVEKSLKQASFVFVADIFETLTTKLADVVIPLCSFAETSGSFTNSLHYLQRLEQAILPISGYENWQVIKEICRRLGSAHRFNYSSVEDIQKEIESLIPEYAFSKLSKATRALFEAEMPIMDPALIGIERRIASKAPGYQSNSVKMWFKNYWIRLGLKDRYPHYFRTEK